MIFMWNYYLWMCVQDCSHKAVWTSRISNEHKEGFHSFVKLIKVEFIIWKASRNAVMVPCYWADRKVTRDVWKNNRNFKWYKQINKLAINEWGWVGYEELSRSRKVLSTKAFHVRHFFFHNQNNSTSSPGLLGNGALTCSGLHFWRHFLVKHKVLSNLVISNWLWWFKRLLLANQNWGNILNE